ncbi:hypothetical protein DFH06DRAFT_1289022 [Mycena polygramma]|nr:hypothetical protein DFH06DRAFT_1289022 [Mycena polygramma]
MDVDVDKQGQRGRSYRCYNCGKFGHMKKDCPDPPKQKFNLRELVSEIEEEDNDSEILQMLADKLPKEVEQERRKHEQYTVLGSIQVEPEQEQTYTDSDSSLRKNI